MKPTKHGGGKARQGEVRRPSQRPTIRTTEAFESASATCGKPPPLTAPLTNS